MNETSKLVQPQKPTAKIAGVKEIDAQKVARIPIKIIPQPVARKPEWIRMKVPDSARYQEIKKYCATIICIPYVKRRVAQTSVNALVAGLLLL